MDFLDQLITNNHYYLGSRNTGASGALRGDVIIIHVLVSDMASNWMFPMHVAEYQNAANQMISSCRHRFSAHQHLACPVAVTVIGVPQFHSHSSARKKGRASPFFQKFSFQRLPYICS